MQQIHIRSEKLKKKVLLKTILIKIYTLEFLQPNLIFVDLLIL